MELSRKLGDLIEDLRDAGHDRVQGGIDPGYAGEFRRGLSRKRDGIGSVTRIAQERGGCGDASQNILRPSQPPLLHQKRRLLLDR